MTVDSYESFHQWSTLIDYHQFGPDDNGSRQKTVKSAMNERKLPSTLMKDLSTFKVDESA